MYREFVFTLSSNIVLSKLKGQLNTINRLLYVAILDPLLYRFVVSVFILHLQEIVLPLDDHQVTW